MYSVLAWLENLATHSPWGPQQLRHNLWSLVQHLPHVPGSFKSRSSINSCSINIAMRNKWGKNMANRTQLSWAPGTTPYSSCLSILIWCDWVWGCRWTAKAKFLPWPDLYHLPAKLLIREAFDAAVTTQVWQRERFLLLNWYFSPPPNRVGSQIRGLFVYLATCISAKIV